MSGEKVNSIEQFLENTHENRKIHLYRLSSKSTQPQVLGKIFFDINEAVAWAKKYNAEGSNIYYAYATPKKNASKKAKKEGLQWLNGFHVDVDIDASFKGDRDAWMDEQVKNILALTPEITPHVILSGNGVQALFEFETALKATPANIAKVEDINRAIAEAVGGDHCHNVDRILRLPGTKNWPNEKKKINGYKVRKSVYLHESDGFFTFNDFAHLPVPETKEKKKYVGTRTDYTKVAYSGKYTPYTYEDLCEYHPELGTFELSGDNSADGMAFICHCIQALVAARKCDACDLPEDIKKNIAHILEDCDEEFMDHYDREGPGKVGYDIEIAHSWAGDELFYTPKVEQKTKHAKKISKIDVANLSQSDRINLILERFRGRCRLDDLPNTDYTTAGLLKPQAPVTLPNVREALKLIGVVPRWDDMRDMMTFRFDDDEVREHMEQLCSRNHNPMDNAQLIYGYVSAFLIEIGLRSEKSLREHCDTISKENRFHPWTEYVTENTWDGQDRITQVADCLKSNHPMKNDYIRTFFLCMGAVALSHAGYVQAGTGQQLDSTLILVGKQGLGKSRFFQHVIPSRYLSNGSSLKVGTSKENDAMRECLGGPLCVLNELGQTLRRSDAESLKDFLAKSIDEYRLPYARNPVVKPRCTVFAGTANELNLTDLTGNRRFMPMKVTGIDLVKLAGIDLQQVYAQAYNSVADNNEPWWLPEEGAKKRDIENEKFRELTESELILDDYMNKVDTQYSYTWLTMTEILKLLDTKYSPWKAMQLKHAMENIDIRFEESITLKNKRTGRTKRKRRVWRFPCTDDMRFNLL